MDADALGVDEGLEISARVSVAAAYYPQSERLCGPSSPVPHNPDSLCGGFQPAAWRKDRFSTVRQPGGAFLLLATASLSCSLRACLVDCVAGVFGPVSVSHE